MTPREPQIVTSDHSLFRTEPNPQGVILQAELVVARRSSEQQQENVVLAEVVDDDGLASAQATAATLGYKQILNKERQLKLKIQNNAEDVT